MLREERGLSLDQLAGALLGHGVDLAASTYSRWERGQGDIAPAAMFALAEVLECSAAHLMGWDKEKKLMEALI